MAQNWVLDVDNWESDPTVATAGSKPAPKKDQIKGSSKNKKGSAKGTKEARKVKFSASVEKSLKEKVSKHNEKAPAGRKASLGMLKAVYRRGAGAFSSSHRPGMTRNQWAMGRVNAFLRLLKSGKPSNPAYTTDNDLLPASHPRSSKKSASIIASGVLVDEERDLATALVEIAEKYGKFDEDGSGIWAGYISAEENEDAAIGVKCSNCVLYMGGANCKIIAQPVEAEGACRFAVLPDGVVKWDGKEIVKNAEEDYYDKQLDVEIKNKEDYEYPEDIILALTEYSGFGYEAEPAIRASWLRALRKDEDPFVRASILASLGHDSLDGDLLPVVKEDEDVNE